MSKAKELVEKYKVEEALTKEIKDAVKRVEKEFKVVLKDFEKKLKDLAKDLEDDELPDISDPEVRIFYGEEDQWNWNAF